MRISLRKAVKIAIVLCLLVFGNVLLWRDFIFNTNSADFASDQNQYGRRGKKEPVDSEVKELGSQDPDVKFLRRPRTVQEAGQNDSLQSLFEKEKIIEVQSVKKKSPVTNNGFIDKHFKGDKMGKTTSLEDVHISVKTTAQYHDSRVKLLLNTWVTKAADQTYFYTDGEDDNLKKAVPRGHVINTNCSSQHNRKALCCKMAVEYDHFVELNKRWFCHVDDDTYLNIPQLVQKLQEYDHMEDWYLGKPSLSHPIEIMDRVHVGQRIAFWFATGGAGFCISKALALKMLPFAGGGKLVTVGEQIRLPDDCTVGYIIEHLLHQELTVIPEFHSHLEPLWQLRASEMKNQITFSYVFYKERENIVNVSGFSKKEDPTRFLSIHCLLNPYLPMCRRLPR